MRPYKDLQSTEDKVVRVFNDNVNPTELVWHRDRENRIIKILEPGYNWHFQFENELPFKIESNMTITVSMGEWHRVIKGQGDLKVEIFKY